MAGNLNGKPNSKETAMVPSKVRPLQGRGVTDNMSAGTRQKGAHARNSAGTGGGGRSYLAGRCNRTAPGRLATLQELSQERGLQAQTRASPGKLDPIPVG